MSLHIQTHSTVEVKRINTELAYALVRDDVAVFRKTVSSVSDTAGHDVQVVEGFALKSGVERYLAGDAEALKMAHYAVLTPQTQEVLRTRGFVAGLEHMSTERENLCMDTPYANLVEQGMDVGLVASMSYDSHSASFLSDGNPVPVAINCCYIDGFFKDGCYDIDKAAAILNSNPNVRPARPFTGLVRNVPHYNESPGCSQYLDFVYMPTREDAKRLWERQVSYGTKRPASERYRAMFDEDILGLRAGRAAYFDTFGATL